MQHFIQISSDKVNGLYDITQKVDNLVKQSKINIGLVNVYTRGATAAIMIQENWDESVQTDGY